MIVGLSRRRFVVSMSRLILATTLIATALPEKPRQDNH
jgi:hypothetical protein